MQVIEIKITVDAKRDAIMKEQFRQILWSFAWLLLSSLAFYSYAVEEPGAITVIVKNQTTDRPLPNAQVILKERETSAIQTLQTDLQGRIVVEQLDPGCLLYTSPSPRD